MAHVSVKKLLALSIFLVKPMIQLPRSSLISPSPLAVPEATSADPLVLSLT